MGDYVKYRGDILKFKPNGKGTLDWRIGNKYHSFKGRFQDGKFNGKGMMNLNLKQEEDKTQSKPKKNKKAKKTKEENLNIAKFIGSFKAGLPDGQGTF